MSAPSITSITPSSGPTGGSLLVEVFGGGFALPVQADAVGPAPRRIHATGRVPDLANISDERAALVGDTDRGC
jgi:hypothetical protein